MVTQLAFPNEPSPALSTRVQLIENLASLRQEWEEAADGESLVDVQSSVGFLLSDITAKLKLTIEEKHLVLGQSLNYDLAKILEEQTAQ